MVGNILCELIRGLDTFLVRVYTRFKMKRMARLILTVAALASLAVSQIPSPARCQMGFGTVLARSCPMPCCKTKLPMPNCPFLKASQPRDLIVPSVSILENALAPLPDSLQATLPVLRPLFQVLARLTTTLHLLSAGPPLSVRAPPSDVHLLDA